MSVCLNSEYQDTIVSIQQPLLFPLFSLVDEERCKKKVDTPDELLARILHATARTKKPEDQLSRTTRDLCTRFAKCAEAGGGILEHL